MEHYLIKQRCWSFFNRPASIWVAHTYWVPNFLSNHQIIEWTENRDDGMTLSLRSESTYWSLVHCLICLNSPMMSFFRKSISAIIDSFGNKIEEPNRLQKKGNIESSVIFENVYVKSMLMFESANNDHLHDDKKWPGLVCSGQIWGRLVECPPLQPKACIWDKTCFGICCKIGLSISTD